MLLKDDIIPIVIHHIFLQRHKHIYNMIDDCQKADSFFDKYLKKKKDLYEK